MTEDFTGYTVADDPNSRLSQTATRSTFTAIQTDDDCFLYKDKGVGHFNGDYEHLFDVNLSVADAYEEFQLWALTNVLKDRYDLENAGEDEHAVLLNNYTASKFRPRVMEILAGALSSDNGAQRDLGTYYLKVKRDEAVGANGTLYCYTYSDAARTDLLETLSIALSEKEDFRYIMMPQAYGTIGDGAKTATGYCENLDLQEAVGLENKSANMAAKMIAGKLI